MTPAPAAGLLWTLIDIALCHFSVLHPIYYLVESTILVAMNVACGIPSVMIYRYLTHSSCHSVTDTDTSLQLGLRRIMDTQHLHLPHCDCVSLRITMNDMLRC